MRGPFVVIAGEFSPGRKRARRLARRGPRVLASLLIGAPPMMFALIVVAICLLALVLQEQYAVVRTAAPIPAERG